MLATLPYCADTMKPMSSRYAIALALLSGAILTAHGQQTPADMAGRVNTSSITPQNFRWQRIITPPRRAPLAEACVLLDAATFANAAPALRDLRLYQDGAELPYVVEQSFDERALDSGITPSDDRSLYETSAMATMQPFGVTSANAAKNVASILLPEHVPVERIRFDPEPAGPALLALRASATEPAVLRGLAETAQGTVDGSHPTFVFTLGANLQSPAEVGLMLSGRVSQPTRVFLEMRRRSLCYHPASASPLVLYLGGGDIAAESYPFARTFQSETDRPYASMGSLLPNPDFHPVSAKRWQLSKPARLAIALAAFALLMIFNARRLFRKVQVPAK